jgi:protein SERAC1
VCTWGYHTLRVDNKPLPLQNDVFTHARELLEELAEARAASNGAARPIIFVAHSTGGIIVKEVRDIDVEFPWTRLTGYSCYDCRSWSEMGH